MVGQLLDFSLIAFLFRCIQLCLSADNSGLFVAYFSLQYLFQASLGFGLGAGLTTGAVRTTGALYLLYEEARAFPGWLRRIILMRGWRLRLYWSRL